MASSVRRPEEGFLESSARLNGLQLLRKSARMAKKNSTENIRKAKQAVKKLSSAILSHAMKTDGLTDVKGDLVEREEALQKRERAMLEREATLLLREQQLQQTPVEVGAEQEEEQKIDQLIEEELGERVFEV